MSLRSIAKSLNGNTFKIIACAIVFGVGLWFFGCQSTVKSVLDPEKVVTRSELKAEVVSFNAYVKSRVQDLDRQDAMRKMLLDEASVMTQGGIFNPIGAINSIISIVAIGSALDSKRKLSNLESKKSASA